VRDVLGAIHVLAAHTKGKLYILTLDRILVQQPDRVGANLIAFLTVHGGIFLERRECGGRSCCQRRAQYGD